LGGANCPIDTLCIVICPPVHFLPSTYRDALISSFGLYTIIDRRALDTAAEYLARHGGDFNSADTALASMYKAAPIPEEYAEHENVFRLAYQLIWCQWRFNNITKFGLVKSLYRFRRSIGLNATYEPFTIGLNSVSVIAFLFLVAISLYIFAIPNVPLSFSDVLKKDPDKLTQYCAQKVTEYPLWPFYECESVCTGLARSLLCSTLGFVFPLFLGLYMYRARSYVYPGESLRKRFRVISIWQLALESR